MNASSPRIKRKIIDGMIHRKRATALIDTKKGILIVREGIEPYFILPGGGMEKGEDSRFALARELKEETNLTMTDCRYLFWCKGGIYKRESGKLAQNYHRVFLVKVVGTPKPKSEIKGISYYQAGSKKRMSNASRKIINSYYKLKHTLNRQNMATFRTA